jgi:hypothetical protein
MIFGQDQRVDPVKIFAASVTRVFDIYSPVGTLPYIETPGIFLIIEKLPKTTRMLV